MGGAIKIIWELLKAAPQIISVISELIKLIRKIAGDGDNTKDGIRLASQKISKIYEIPLEELQIDKPI